MIPVGGFEGQQVAVLGLGSSGMATAKALAAGAARPVCWDDELAAREAASAEGFTVSDLVAANWSEIAALVLSPGVPLTHPVPHPIVRQAIRADISIIGDLELFARERRRAAPQAPLVAVTGTNGKSTTVALIAHILSQAGRDVVIGGNFGPPVLSQPAPAMTRTHVLECSSYQIELAPSLDPTIGVLLNISPDHLDRHGSIERYAEIKSRLLSSAERAVIGVDDSRSALIADHIEQAGGSVTRVSVRGPLADGITVHDGLVIKVAAAAEEPLLSINGIKTLRGNHNAQNAAAAVAVAKALGLDNQTILAGVNGFAGLPHRMEEVGRIGRVLLINDSKATNADATARALSSFNHIYWIVGGRPKSEGIKGLAPLFSRVTRAFLIGEAADAFASSMEGRLAYDLSSTLERAVADAIGHALKSQAEESVVLLSPAAASFDQFKNFADRGEAFTALAHQHMAENKETAA